MKLRKRFYHLANCRETGVKQNCESAAYVDRILKGEKAADLPVQAAISQDRQGPRDHGAAHIACARRRGDRVTAYGAGRQFAAVPNFKSEASRWGNGQFWPRTRSLLL